MLETFRPTAAARTNKDRSKGIPPMIKLPGETVMVRGVRRSRWRRFRRS